jgi:hypothetical protein
MHAKTARKLFSKTYEEQIMNMRFSLLTALIPVALVVIMGCGERKTTTTTTPGTPGETTTTTTTTQEGAATPAPGQPRVSVEPAERQKVIVQPPPEVQVETSQKPSTPESTPK